MAGPPATGGDGRWSSKAFLYRPLHAGRARRPGRCRVPFAPLVCYVPPARLDSHRRRRSPSPSANLNRVGITGSGKRSVISPTKAAATVRPTRFPARPGGNPATKRPRRECSWPSLPPLVATRAPGHTDARTAATSFRFSQFSRCRPVRAAAAPTPGKPSQVATVRQILTRKVRETGRLTTQTYDGDESRAFATAHAAAKQAGGNDQG